MTTVPSSTNNTKLRPTTVDELVERSYKNSVLEVKIWKELIKSLMNEVTKALGVGETVKIDGLGEFSSRRDPKGNLFIAYKPSSRLKTTLEALAGKNIRLRHKINQKNALYHINKAKEIERVVAASQSNRGIQQPNPYSIEN